MVPSDGLVDSGWCLAQPGREYVVFQNQPAPFQVELAGVSGTLQAEWFNPHTGARTPAGKHGNGKIAFAPPESWGQVPAVLHLKSPR